MHASKISIGNVYTYMSTYSNCRIWTCGPLSLWISFYRWNQIFKIQIQFNIDWNQNFEKLFWFLMNRNRFACNRLQVSGFRYQVANVSLQVSGCKTQVISIRFQMSVCKYHVSIWDSKYEEASIRKQLSIYN